MRVLMTTDTVGGVWTFTQELTQQLLAQGHRVALVSFGRTVSAAQSAWTEGMAASYRRHFLFRACDAPLEWMQCNADAWVAGAELLTHLAESFQTDILHSNQFCWAALRLDVPKIITAHSDIRSWATACGKQLPPSTWLDTYSLLVQNGIDGADAIVAPGTWMRDALLENFAVAAPVHVIPNGRTLPGLLLGEQRELRAVSVGRLWDEGKGLAILSQIESPMPIVIAGERCFERSLSGILPPTITELGTLDETNLFRLFSSSSVYMATSLYEPFGLAPLEAALCGCAIVARNLSSLREVWGDAALYFTNAAELENILTELSSSPAALHMARCLARERACSFSGERMAASYVNLYLELIERAAGVVPMVYEEKHAA